MTRTPSAPQGSDSENDQALEDYVASFFSSPFTESNQSLAKNETPINPPLIKEDQKYAIVPTSVDLNADNNPDSNDVTETAWSASPERANYFAPEPKPLPNIALIPAESVPADIALNDNQKADLQKLLNRSIRQSLEKTIEKTVTAPKIFTPEQAVTLGPVVEVDVRPDVPNIEATSVGIPSVLEREVPCASEINVELPEEGDSTDSLPPVNCDSELKPQKDFRAHWQGEYPSWAGDRFDVLLFTCRGVTLAIPLISLGHIYWQTEPLNQLPAMPSHILGIRAAGERKLKIIDAGAYFFPTRAASSDQDDSLHIIAIADSDWGLAVDSVANPLKMQRSDIQWQRKYNTTPWLAGAIRKPMCMLIDTPSLLISLDAF